MFEVLPPLAVRPTMWPEVPGSGEMSSDLERNRRWRVETVEAVILLLGMVFRCQVGKTARHGVRATIRPASVG